MRTIPKTFDLRTQRPIRQSLGQDDEEFMESQALGSFEKLRDWAIVKKSTYHTIWRHDWQEMLSSIGVNDATSLSMLTHLALPGTPMPLLPVHQGACDSCWAIAISTSLTDRFRVAYQDPGFPALSPVTLMIALNSACCQANFTVQSAKWVETGGLEPWCCTPYGETPSGSCKSSYQLSRPYETPVCEDGNGMLPTATPYTNAQQCQVAYTSSGDARYFTVADTAEYITGHLPTVIQKELLERGTVIGEITLYSDFSNQCSLKSRAAFAETGGVYMHSMCFPRYRADFITLVKRTISPAYTQFFIDKIGAFGKDLSSLWVGTNVAAHFTPHQDKLVFLRCGFYGLKDPRYMPMDFIGGTETVYGQHALSVLGWGVQKDVMIENYGVTLDIPYWICRNSYGANWCGDGHVKIAMSIHSHTYPDGYMFSDLSRDLGLEKNHYGTGVDLTPEPNSRPATCPHRTRCGGAIAPGVPNLRASNWSAAKPQQGDVKPIVDSDPAATKEGVDVASNSAATTAGVDVASNSAATKAGVDVASSSASTKAGVDVAPDSAWPLASRLIQFMNSKVESSWVIFTGLIGILVIILLLS